MRGMRLFWVGVGALAIIGTAWSQASTAATLMGSGDGKHAVRPDGKPIVCVVNPYDPNKSQEQVAKETGPCPWGTRPLTAKEEEEENAPSTHLEIHFTSGEQAHLTNASEARCDFANRKGDVSTPECTAIPEFQYGSNCIGDDDPDDASAAPNDPNDPDDDGCAVDDWSLETTAYKTQAYTVFFDHDRPKHSRFFNFRCWDTKSYKAVEFAASDDLENEHGLPLSFRVRVGARCVKEFVHGGYTGSGLKAPTLLSYVYPQGPKIEALQGKAKLVLIYGGAAQEKGFAATLDGKDVSKLFHPSGIDMETVTLDVSQGEHMLEIRMEDASEKLKKSDVFTIEAK